MVAIIAVLDINHLKVKCRLTDTNLIRPALPYNNYAACDTTNERGKQPKKFNSE